MARFIQSFFTLMLIVNTTFSQTDTSALALMETEFDFGKIPQGVPVYHNFEVKNNSSKPLILANVQASCGCTTPEWIHEPISPGKATTIKVGFNALVEGDFNKPVTITYSGNLSKSISIKGNVWKTPLTQAPVNSSLKFLKNQSL